MDQTALDMDAYLRRIGVPEAGAPSLSLLRTLIARHTRTVPFENLDILLGRPILIDPASLQVKLVRQQRGGYCFEQNTLFRAVLDRLGFRTSMLMARVVAGGDEDAERPRAHVAIRVSLPEGDWLADVGFGNLTPTAPLWMASSDAQPTGHERFRLRPRANDIALDAERNGRWQTLYRFTTEPTYPIDHAVANWFTFTWPNGLFSSNMIVARPGESCRKTLLNGRFTSRAMEGAKQTRAMTGAADLRTTLREEFALEVTEEEAGLLSERLAGFKPDGADAAGFEG